MHMSSVYQTNLTGKIWCCVKPSQQTMENLLKLAFTSLLYGKFSTNLEHWHFTITIKLSF